MLECDCARCKRVIAENRLVAGSYRDKSLSKTAFLVLAYAIAYEVVERWSPAGKTGPFMLFVERFDNPLSHGGPCGVLPPS
jgi:hypothetical protein